MIINLTFDNENQDDRVDYEIYRQAPEMHTALFNIQHNLKRRIENKLDSNNASEKEYELLEEIFNAISKETLLINLDL